MFNRKKDTRVESGRQVYNLEFLCNRVNSGDKHLKQKFNYGVTSTKFSAIHHEASNNDMVVHLFTGLTIKRQMFNTKLTKKRKGSKSNLLPFAKFL